MLKSFLFNVRDTRREQGQRYELSYVLLYSILAILSGADSYRSIFTFIEIKLTNLNEIFDSDWEKPPAYSTIRNILIGIDKKELETCFREYSSYLNELEKPSKFIAIDGKTLRGSFDNFKGKKAVQILSLFASESKIILAHEEVSEKTNEIPIAQDLLEKLEMNGHIFTFDAMNCQKKL